MSYANIREIPPKTWHFEIVKLLRCAQHYVLRNIMYPDYTWSKVELWCNAVKQFSFHLSQIFLVYLFIIRKEKYLKSCFEVHKKVRCFDSSATLFFTFFIVILHGTWNWLTIGCILPRHHTIHFDELDLIATVYESWNKKKHEYRQTATIIW